MGVEVDNLCKLKESRFFVLSPEVGFPQPELSFTRDPFFTTLSGCGEGRDCLCKSFLPKGKLPQPEISFVSEVILGKPSDEFLQHLFCLVRFSKEPVGLFRFEIHLSRL